jgi:hypothetical protein
VELDNVAGEEGVVGVVDELGCVGVEVLRMLAGRFNSF